jgi:ABC-type branched-subunit amino acid transport system ATPase component
MSVLEVCGVGKRFTGVEALSEVDLTVEQGEIVGLIGPNGSGKSTLFNCITGIYRVDEGSIVFDGIDITYGKPHQAALAGLSRSFQMVQVYPRLTVRENLLIAIQEHQERNALARLVRSATVRQAERTAKWRADEILGSLNLVTLRDLPVGTLSYGQRKLIEFAAILMPDPKLVLLDEPAAAINPTMINRMKGHIRNLRAMGKAVLMVEHNMSLVMDICDRVVVLDHGRIIAKGEPAVVKANPRVLEAYFGQ